MADYLFENSIIGLTAAESSRFSDGTFGTSLHRRVRYSQHLIGENQFSNRIFYGALIAYADATRGNSGELKICISGLVQPQIFRISVSHDTRNYPAPASSSTATPVRHLNSSPMPHGGLPFGKSRARHGDGHGATLWSTWGRRGVSSAWS